MKQKFITHILCTIIGITLGVSASWAISQERAASEMDYYAYANSLDLAEIIDSSDLTFEEIENRNGKLIIERVIGVVEDAETGAGHCVNGEEYWNYISYNCVDKIHNGDVICTYFVYNPDTNYYDDIISRFDYVIDTKEN